MNPMTTHTAETSADSASAGTRIPGLLDEATLVARLRAADRVSAEAVVRQHAGRMLAVARRLLGCAEDSADVVQDAFLSAFRALPRFEGHSSLATWLHRIVVNSCLMKLRTRSRRRQVPIDEVLPAFAETGHQARPVRPGGEQADTRLEREEMRAQIHACIARLPDSYRTVLVLRDLEELDTEQTARQLGLAPGAVKTRLHRARQALRALLEPLVLNESAA
jgi:RNA polymerase sigma-70 factor (ECF subfamily)